MFPRRGARTDREITGSGWNHIEQIMQLWQRAAWHTSQPHNMEPKRFMFALHLLAHWLSHLDSGTEFWAFWGCAFLQLCEFVNVPRKQYTLSMLGATSQRLFRAQHVTNSQTLHHKRDVEMRSYTTNVMLRRLTTLAQSWLDAVVRSVSIRNIY